MTSADSDLAFGTVASTTSQSSAAVFTRLLKYLKPYRARLFATLLVALAAVGFELLRPWPVQVVVDYGINGLAQPEWLEAVTSVLPKADSDSGLIVWASLAAIGIVIAGGVLSYLTLLLSVSIAKELVFTLSMQTFSKLQRLSLAYHSNHPTGDSLQRVSQDVFVLYFLVANVAIPGLVALITLAGMFFVLARLDLVMAFVTISVAPFLAIALAIFAKPMDRATNRQYAAQGAVMSLVEQSLSAIKVIQGFSREAYVQKKVEFGAREMSDTSGDSIRISGAYNVVSTAITGIAAAVLLAIGAFQVQEGRLTLGEMLVFLGYVSALFGPVTQLTLATGYAVQISARGRRVFDVLDAKEVVQERPGAIQPTAVSGKLEFRDVSFSYSPPEAANGSGMILEDITFRANPGEMVAIVGPTGAGKTTLVALISRFFDPTEGTVLIDGIDVRDYSLTALREQIALVLQEPFLFPMSIADNIGFGRPSASRDEIVAAAKAAHAHDFIMNLPEGYETVLDARAGNLSGGEKQRISIARAMLKDAPILILDEPTSALDAHTESLIFEALSTLMETRTTLLISHRLSTMRRAHQILVLSGGKIVERGTHDSLLSTGRLYPKLYQPHHDQLRT